MTSTEIQAEGQRTPQTRKGFRTDIQGLRALAVGIVLLYHANAPFLPGGFVGVDVFFVISGFLITGILLREAHSTGRVNLLEFYAKRVRRILPAATVVLLATALLAYLFLPDIRWRSLGIETVASAVYVVNWVFSAGTDYLNAEVAASPLQHFWTLAVEEQFYIVWPLVIVGVLLVAQRYSRRAGAGSQLVHRLFSASIVLLFALSFLWSVSATHNDPAPSYFSTATRLWELAIGAMVAVHWSQLQRIRPAAGRVLSWIGFAGILAAALFFSSETPFPGYSAMLPTASAALVIIGGAGLNTSRGAGRLLSLRPVVWVGNISYSLYLWHWPLIVVVTYLTGGELSFLWGFATVALSFLPAWLSYRFIENPFRLWRPIARSSRMALMAGGAMVLVSIAAGLSLVAVQSPSTRDTVSLADAPGARILEDDPSAGDPVDEVSGGFVPAAVDARQDNSVIYENGCHADDGVTTEPGCTFGPADADFSVVLVGDSHAASWAPTLEKLADQNGWFLTIYTKSACPFADVTPSYQGGVPYENCVAWNSLVMSEIQKTSPDLLLTTNSADRYLWIDGEQRSFEASESEFADGLQRSWSELRDSGIPVAVIADVPKMLTDVPECVSSHPAQLTECASDRDAAIELRTHPEQLAADGLTGIDYIDMNRWICPGEKCAAVIGQVLVWRDSQHLTASFATTLAEPLFEELRSRDLVPARL